MKKANLHEAKTSLSKLVDLAIKGEEVVICKAGHPVAKLIAIRTHKKKRKPGIWAGRVKIEEDFDELPASFMRYFK